MRWVALAVVLALSNEHVLTNVHSRVCVCVCVRMGDCFASLHYRAVCSPAVGATTMTLTLRCNTVRRGEGEGEWEEGRDVER